MRIRSLIVTAVLTLAVSGISMAQEQPERGERGERFQRERGERPERGEWGAGGRMGERGDGQQIRQRLQDMIKQQLQVSDEEWEVLAPKIERVTTAQRNARAGAVGMLGMGARGGAGPAAAQREESELVSATRELRTAIQSESAGEQEIAQKLAAYRAAREKAEAELTTAQTELRDLLTERQEAALVLLGLLQ
jgi:hypothetical protein